MCSGFVIVMCTYMGQEGHTCACLSAQELLNSEMKVLPKSRHFSFHTRAGYESRKMWAGNELMQN